VRPLAWAAAVAWLACRLAPWLAPALAGIELPSSDERGARDDEAGRIGPVVSDPACPQMRQLAKLVFGLTWIET
jgi:hypothetical protein